MPSEAIITKLENDRRILELLAQNFPNVSAASTEIINLEAILNLPKGTEHFVADLHGEHEAFSHILRNASGNIKRKVKELFGASLRDQELRDLCTLIYYPERKLEYLKQAENDVNDFYAVTLFRLVRVLQSVSSKYTRSKVRKALPHEFAYIIQELLHESPSDDDKDAYFQRIIETIISTGQADDFIVAICNVIQRLSIDQLHVLGDIFDRGPGAHIIMDTLCEYDRFDIQWGNHDALWMGAFAGNEACMANVVRLSLRYNNLVTLEDGYGINLMPLATFAMETYADDPCTKFEPVVSDEENIDPKTLKLMAKMHKAIAVIQFKLEGHIIDRRPQWGMADRKVLSGLRPDLGTVTLDGKTYPLTDTSFPTIDPADPYRLSPEEETLVARLRHSFQISDRLARHIQCLFSHGCLYKICNSNLLFHASIPLDANGQLKEVELYPGQRYSGKALMNHIGMLMRSVFNDDTDPERKAYALDYYWYLWCGPDSVLFDKSKMATFERYFIDDPETHKEQKGHFYLMRNDEDVCNRILDAFGVEGEHRHIINGHVPVRINKGESPIRANGRLLVIDGGFAKAYHKKTGIAGYTLVYHSRGLQLVQHEPFASTEQAITDGTDIVSSTQIVELSTKRMRVRDTDKGKALQSQIDELTDLLYAFRHGIVMQRSGTKS
ncbi:MAG: fructose-1,6-bisphosphatase [Muribaculum sp.]|nr:fructose-1,6-bisphosphatase [Muribaculum sp.]